MCIEENDTKSVDSDYTAQCRQIYHSLRKICFWLDLDFEDFRDAFLGTGKSYTNPESLDRILRTGWKPSFLKNPKKRKNFLDAVKEALENCVNGENPLLRSDARKVKEAYLRLKRETNFSFENFRNHLSLRMTFALRADPESLKEEEESFQEMQMYRAAKYFWEGMENHEFETIDGAYYKIHIPLCDSFCNMLKNNPVIMKRIQDKFEKVDENNKYVVDESQ